jgi:hypothetical protein
MEELDEQESECHAGADTSTAREDGKGLQAQMSIAMTNQIWVMSRGEDQSKHCARNGVSDSEIIHCPKDPDHQRPGKRIRDLNVEFPLDALTDEVSWTGESNCLVRQSLSSLFRLSGITGFETRPIEVTLGGIPIDHDQEELLTVGWGGIASLGSGVTLDDKESCLACGHLVYTGVKDWSNLIDFRQWDGSDIFMVWPLPRFVLVTDKVAKLLTDKKIRELTLTPLCAMEPEEGELSPGRVGYWLSQEKMRSVSVPSDIA